MMDETVLRARGGSLLFSDLENPNKMPFTGVLTYLGVPSDMPPGGSGGLKVLIPVEVGRAALESLKGMPVNLAASMDDHDTSAVIGVIEDAWLGEPDARGAVPLHVRGHIFAKSFPNEARAIKSQQAALGFSYETAKTSLTASTYNGETVAVANSLVFTGAAILYKAAAAYQSTSLAASADLLELIKVLQTRVDELEARKVSAEERKEMDDSDFAVPGKRKLLINDATHVKLAWDMVDRTEGLTPEERAEARRRILRRAHELGIDTSNWEKHGDIKAGAEEEVNMADETKVVEETTQEVTAAAEETTAEEVTTEAEVEAAKSADDESLDKKDVKLDSELVKLLPQVLDAVKELSAKIDKLAEKEVKAAAEEPQEPKRRSHSALVSKYPTESEAKKDIFAAAEVEDDPVKSMASKLSAVFGN